MCKVLSNHGRCKSKLLGGQTSKNGRRKLGLNHRTDWKERIHIPAKFYFVSILLIFKGRHLNFEMIILGFTQFLLKNTVCFLFLFARLLICVLLTSQIWLGWRYSKSALGLSALRISDVVILKHETKPWK